MCSRSRSLPPCLLLTSHSEFSHFHSRFCSFACLLVRARHFFEKQEMGAWCSPLLLIHLTSRTHTHKRLASTRPCVRLAIHCRRVKNKSFVMILPPPARRTFVRKTQALSRMLLQVALPCPQFRYCPLPTTHKKSWTSGRRGEIVWSESVCGERGARSDEFVFSLQTQRHHLIIHKQRRGRAGSGGQQA
jgi:hypothetical protein